MARYGKVYSRSTGEITVGLRLALLLLALNAILPTSAFADAKLTATDAAAADMLGDAVAVYGNTVAVAALGDDCVAGPGCGAVYIFEKPVGGWEVPLTQVAKLTASDGGSDFFGQSVSISEDAVVVGAIWNACAAGIQCGAAYVFQKPIGGWAGSLTESAKLVASDAAAVAFFGLSVSISGDTVVVGAGLTSCTAGALCGSAYVFQKPGGGWAGTLTENAKLVASDAAAAAFFGSSVSISGDDVLVGSPSAFGGCAGGARCGAAYLFRRPGGGWAGTLTENAQLFPSDGASFQNIGTRVSLSGDTAVMGTGCLSFVVDCGAAYVYQKPGGGWAGVLTENAKLVASDGVTADFFGPISISGKTIVAGTRGDDCADGAACGSAYVFRKPAGGWSGVLTEDSKLVASDAAAGDQFGGSAFLFGGTAVIGAPSDACTAGSECGSAYVYVIDSIDDLSNDLVSTISNLGLPSAGIAKALIAKIEAARIAIANGRLKNAENLLQAFLQQVGAQRGKGLTETQADELSSQALILLSLL